MTETSRTERILGPLYVRLRGDLHVSRQRTRGGPRYIVHDPVSFQNHAFTPADYRILTSIVGQNSLADNLRRCIDAGLLTSNAEDRQGFYRFVLWLHQTGLVHLPITGSAAGSNPAAPRTQKQPWYGFLLSKRIPLGNPGALLDRLLPFVGWLFGRAGLALWLGLLAVVLWKCLGRVDEMVHELPNLMALGNLPALWLLLVALKVLHEFGHAIACRRHGASVPEMGVQLIMLTPCAYVDAGASWRLPHPRQRIVVGLAGMYVESFVAAIAAIVWAGTPPGLAHDLALNVVVLAGAATVLFNANPLMRYDGYYVVSDLLGVFNLQQRAGALLNGWVSHVLLATPRPQSNHNRSEFWLYAAYGPAAFVYRCFLAFALTALVVSQWPAAGLVLGALFAWALIAQPVLKLLVHLWSSPRLEAVRPRARIVAVTGMFVVPAVAGLAPVSWSVEAPGVLDPQTRTSVRAPSSGFVREVATANGESVAAGARLCTLSNPDLEMRRQRLVGELEAEQEQLDAIELTDQTQAAVHRSRVAYLRASVAEIDRRLATMQVVAAGPGIVVAPDGDGLRGRFLQQGEELFQVHSGHRWLRIVLTEDEVSRARVEVGSIAEVRWTTAPDQPTTAIVREVRAAASRLDVPPQLTMLGGGDVYVRPTRTAMAAADVPYLHVFLEVARVPEGAERAGMTARVQMGSRVELLGQWVHKRVLAFVDAWRMS
jgi:putative peptide zinc metalloprotease protein